MQNSVATLFPMVNPVCPVTGKPAVKLVQWVSVRFLVNLWRIIFKVDARSSFGQQQRVGLWESPTGLCFFDPPLEGDHAFYEQFYEFLLQQKLWSNDAIRREFELAARRIRPGDRVLDVGCGFASFRRVIPQASYIGLDPHFAGHSDAADVSSQTLREHLVAHAGAYDAVCAFQVLEHVKAPASMFADMVRAARPGGYVIIGVPHVPSALTRIPNFVLNAPPHHLTWWTEAALRALAEGGGAAVETIEHAEWNETDSLLYWMARCSPIRCSDVHFYDRWSWHAAALVGFLAGRMLHVVSKVPRTTDEGGSLLMVARRTS
jgi:SAM-dependent methyltransferase